MEEGLKPLSLNCIQITDPLFGSYTKLVADKIIPYQWEILNDRVEDAIPTHCIDNFKIAAGEMLGERKGVIFQDTDLYKWIEAVSYSMENGCGNQFKETVEDVISLIGRAQESDGYLNTYYTVNAPAKKWSNLVEGHELYTAGHLIEAAVAYYLATGQNALLNIAVKNADLICNVFGQKEGQIKGYPGHQEIELALIKLYRITQNKRYLNCARYFIEERGSSPNYFQNEISARGGYEYFHEFADYDLKYSQSHLPPLMQRTAEGHAVRAMYMYSAMADLALEYGDSVIMEACLTLWNNITKRRMYITGGIGSSGFLERFTTDYDLPNRTNYSETCASIGLMMFGQRMTAATKNAVYYDTVERALYNTVLAGINVTGDKYFYVNPLEMIPDFCTDHSYMLHVKPERQRWFSVACCPPNLARTLASLGKYIYAFDEKALYINLFISSQAEVQIGKTTVKAELQSTLLQDGRIKLRVETHTVEPLAIESPDYESPHPFSHKSAPVSIRIRIPEYADSMRVYLDEKEISVQECNKYACFDGISGKKEIEIAFNLKPYWVSANSKVHEDVGKIALMKGPCVYCLEEADNGSNLASLYVTPDTELKEGNPLEGLFGELPTIEYNGTRLINDGPGTHELYGKPAFHETPVKLKAIPYCLWNNRGRGEMIVWNKVKL